MAEDLIEKFQTIEDSFNDEWISGNTELISKYISDDWVSLDPKFGIVSKEGFMHVIEEKVASHLNEKRKCFALNF